MSKKILTPEDLVGYKSRYGVNQRINGDYDQWLAVKCINGTFVGKKDDDVLSFKGIPFVGEQPVGKNRFKKPVPFKEDDGVYEAYYYGPVPYQEEAPMGTYFYEKGEECLTLNVFKNTKDTTPCKPVMVWIHGGAFDSDGTSNPTYDGQCFVTDNPDVIFVTLEYRLGLFGFVHLSHLPGGEKYPDAQNNGVLDCLMALKWVHENIAGFGGDPQNVTIFGESAGGGMVSLLSLIPEARGYFHRVIAQSGSAAFARSPEMSIAAQEAAFANIGITSVDEFVNLPADKIVEANLARPMATWPERDGRILPVEPWEVMRSGALKDIDFIQGCNRHEMNSFRLGAGDDGFVQGFGAMYEEKLNVVSPEHARKAHEFLKEFDNPADAYAEMGAQAMLGGPTIRQAEELTAGGGKAYQYLFRVESSIPGLGSAHGMEVNIVLDNLDFELLSARPIDETFAHTMQRMWVNFAKTGNPSLSAEESPTGKAIEWAQYNSETKPIMVFDEFDVHPSTEAEVKIIDWERVYPLTDYYLFLP